MAIAIADNDILDSGFSPSSDETSATATNAATASSESSTTPIEVEQSVPSGRESYFSKFRNVRRRICGFISVEPMLFLHMVAWSSIGMNVQNFYIQRICEKEYSGNPSIDCSNLTNHAAEEAHVEEIATVYSTLRNLIEAGLPVIFSLFLGPFSDKHGSKYTMVLPLVGFTLSTVMLYIFSLLKTVDPTVLLLASIPVALTGGMIAFILSAFKYIAADSDLTDRSFRMAIGEGSWFLGSPLGLLGSAALLKYNGFQLVFLVCIIVYTLATLYALFIVKNDKPVTTDSDDPNSNICSDMFNVEALKDTFHTTFGPRAASQRMLILLLMGTTFLRVFTIYGSMTITLMYTRIMFQWDSAAYSAYVTYDGLVGIAGSATVAVLGMKIFKVSDAKIGLLSSISYLLGSIIWLISGFTGLSWVMYLGATSQMFCGLITIICRSMISKMVHKDELGKIYSVLASGEASVPLIATPIYNYIYDETLETFPAACYILTITLNVVTLFVFIYFCILPWLKRDVPHQQLEDDTVDYTVET